MREKSSQGPSHTQNHKTIKCMFRREEESGAGLVGICCNKQCLPYLAPKERFRKCRALCSPLLGGQSDLSHPGPLGSRLNLEWRQHCPVPAIAQHSPLLGQGPVCLLLRSENGSSDLRVLSSSFPEGLCFIDNDFIFPCNVTTPIRK